MDRPSPQMRVNAGFRPVLAVLLATASSCAPRLGPNAALTRFPIGIYGVDEASDIARIKEGGFDAFQSYNLRPDILEKLATEASRRGMRMLAYADPLRDGGEAAPRGWPVDAWYLVDEPDVQRISPDKVRALAEKTKKWDTRRPSAFVVGQGAGILPFGDIADIVMLDWYPVPHLPLDSVADHLDIVRRHIPKGKPLWMVIQAFDWRLAEQRDPSKPRIGRFPTSDEMKFMSYLAIMHGATGLYYFAFRPSKDHSLFDNPAEWEAVSRVAREMKAFRPIVENGERTTLPFPPDPDGPEAAAWRYRGRMYVVVLNRKRNAYKKLPPDLLKSKWRPLFDNRRDIRERLKQIHSAWYLKPHQVLVLESRLWSH